LDSLFWHKQRYIFDKKKSDYLKKEGITLIRLREVGLKNISMNDLSYSLKESDFIVLRNIFRRILEIAKLDKVLLNKIKRYLKDKILINQNEYEILLNMLPSPLPGQSLGETNKMLAKEWHPIKNLNLSPNDVASYAGLKVWWKCTHGHEWKATIDQRNRGTGCPYCSGNKVCIDNCLFSLNPLLAKEWHPTINGVLTPKDVTANSRKMVFWLCRKGHEWKATIYHRNRGNGCPYCAGKKVCKENCLKNVNPILAKEWHPSKNGTYTAEDFTSGSHFRAWWLCEKGHAWESTIYDRVNGNGCPYCSGKKPSLDNCLQSAHPELAEEWHPIKNRILTPKEVTKCSGKKVWWLCKNGHEWEAKISNRVNGRGCPYCAGKKCCADNCLQTIKPDIAKEWNLSRNKELAPNQVTPGSNKKVWWTCERGHEWMAVIRSRTTGSGCPYCYRLKNN
jgi:hypothetical protein